MCTGRMLALAVGTSRRMALMGQASAPKITTRATMTPQARGRDGLAIGVARCTGFGRRARSVPKWIRRPMRSSTAGSSVMASARETPVTKTPPSPMLVKTIRRGTNRADSATTTATALRSTERPAVRIAVCSAGT